MLCPRAGLLLQNMQSVVGRQKHTLSFRIPDLTNTIEENDVQGKARV